MAPPSLIRCPLRHDFRVCASLVFLGRKSGSKLARRTIATDAGQKSDELRAKLAKTEWEMKALRVRDGKEESMLTILEGRGLVHKITGNRADVERILTDRRCGAYVGIDPTAPSLHVGHMLPFMALFWMYIHGYHTVSLLGGATSAVGDPTGRLKSRENHSEYTRTENMDNMHSQLKGLWKNVALYAGKYGYENKSVRNYELINNNTWWNTLPLLEVIQVLGPGMRLGSMLARDTVKNKMEKGDGMSWAEFTYPLMQAWDWWHMYHTKEVQIQIGGKDQYGNITAGMDAIKYIAKTHPDFNVRWNVRDVGEPFGFTVPLLTTSSGAKFGKSAGNAIWLDGKKTSPFNLYGYFLRTADEDVEKHLKMFTFMPISEINLLAKEHSLAPELRKAQHKLAREFVELVHGVEAAEDAENHHRLVFRGKNSAEGEKADGAEASSATARNRPKANITFPRSFLNEYNISKMIFASGLEKSRSAAIRLIEQGGAYIARPHDIAKTSKNNDLPSFDWLPIQKDQVSGLVNFIIDEEVLILRKGKSNVRFVQLVSDEDYVMNGKGFPSQPIDWKAIVLCRMLRSDSWKHRRGSLLDMLATEVEMIEDADRAEAAKNGKESFGQSFGLRSEQLADELALADFDNEWKKMISGEEPDDKSVNG